MKRNEFLKGIKSGVPICLGYLSVSFAFGVYSVSSGLTPVEAILISTTNITSAGQLAAVPVIVSGGTLLELAVSQLIINLRYFLMGVLLSQKCDSSVSLFDKLVMAFVNTDEVFAVAVSNKSVSKWYMFGLILTPWAGWTVGTAVGTIAGNILPQIIVTSLSVAIYGMLIAIFVPVAREDKNVLFCVSIAVALSCMFKYVPALSKVDTGFVIIICAVIASGISALLFPLKEEKKENEV